jgi:hypothetical protein
LLGLAFLRGSDTCAGIFLGAFGVAVAVIHYNDLGISFLSNTGNRTMRFGVGKRVLDLVVSVCCGECLGSVMLRWRYVRGGSTCCGGCVRV